MDIMRFASKPLIYTMYNMHNCKIKTAIYADMPNYIIRIILIAVDERYVMLGGGVCTVQRYEALQGGGGRQVFRKKMLRNT